MTDSAEHWLKKAEAARAKAEAHDNPDLKALLLSIAERYEGMAQRIEGQTSRKKARQQRPSPRPSR